MDPTLRRFGEVLFDELKQVVVRRGQIAALLTARERLERAERQQCSDSIRSEQSRIVRKLRSAVDALEELARVIRSEAESVRQVAEKDREQAVRHYDQVSQSRDGTPQQRHDAEQGRNEAVHRDEAVRNLQDKLDRLIEPIQATCNVIPAALSTFLNSHDFGGIREILEKLPEFHQEILQLNEDLESMLDGCLAAASDGGRSEIEESIADAARTAALAHELVGLSFSGGGIRSATFNLGILQGLADSGLLRTFDYLSTVSGGGYIGGWFAAWVHREEDVDNVEIQLQPRRTQQSRAMRRWPSAAEIEGQVEDPDLARRRPLHRVLEEEPEPIYHLRRYSNYLAPRVGALSIDTWSMLSTYARNLLLNQLVLLAAAMVLMLTPRILLAAFQAADVPSWVRTGLIAGMLGLGALGFGMVFFFLLANRMVQRAAGDPSPRSPEGFWARGIPQDRRTLLFLIIGPLGVTAALFSFFFARRGHAGLDLPISLLAPRFWAGWFSVSPDDWLAKYLFPSVAFGLLAGAFRSLCYAITWMWWLPWRSPRGPRKKRVELGEFFLNGFFGFLSGAASAAVLYVVLIGLRTSLLDAPELLAPTMLTFGPPLVILSFLLLSSVESGLLGTEQAEGMREWRASLGAYLMLCALGWSLVVGTSLYGPLLIAASGPYVAAALGSGWLATSLSGVLAGYSARTRNGQGGFWELVALVAPPVFLAGLTVLVSIVSCLVQGITPPFSVPPGTYRDYWLAMDHLSWGRTYLVWFLLLMVALAFSTRLNVNLFSLHAFYANRLVRCYLGASRREGPRPSGWPHFAPTNAILSVRRPNPITGFDPNDDFPLKELAAWSSSHLERGYQGPYPLINTTMNLVSGQELAWQERMAEPFVMTPLYAGSKSTGYRKMRISGPSTGTGDGTAAATTGYGADLRLGTAVSISGAAASPNMGYHSSPAVTFLLTVFNARLGWWLGNPACDTWRESGPRWGFYLFKELFGRTDSESRYVYLSDGGHFENLGVYELIRRRCRYIVVCDAGEDPALAFWDLGSLVRKCREDLGVRIEIDIAPLLKQDPTGHSRWHCATGRIRYDDVDTRAIPGVIVYIKPSITGDEASDIRNYVVEHPAFPHEPTANQFFSESQFESYRALGEHIAGAVFRSAACDAVRHDPSGECRATVPRELFEALHRRWFPPPPHFDEVFLKSVDSYIAIQDALRSDPNLGRLSAELYPENGLDTGRYSLQDRAEIHAIGQVLQVMENVWLTVGLESFADHPMNRGWMNWFRRWCGTSVFQKYWPTLRGEFSRDFVRFAEEELHLRVEPPKLEPYAGSGPRGDRFREAIQGLEKEFLVEWPVPTSATDPNDLTAIVDRLAHAESKANRLHQGVLAWVIPEPSGVGREGDAYSGKARACGVILAWKTRDGAVGREVIELFVWIRGAYRTLGIGRHCITEAIQQIAGSLRSARKRMPLRVSYPSNDGARSEDQWQSTLWLNFFQSLGFTRLADERVDLEKLTLYRFDREPCRDDRPQRAGS